MLASCGEGKRFGIHLDRDGLQVGGQPGTQVTWMDAKVDERVVTPRSGKAVAGTGALAQCAQDRL
ncbi:amylo-alpha-1,6-glucosidase [Nitrospira sp. Nam74]